MVVGADIGAASRMKMIVNMIMGTVVAGLAEGMAMAEKVGLDQEDVAEVLSIGALSCPTIIHKSQGKSRTGLNSIYCSNYAVRCIQSTLRNNIQDWTTSFNTYD